MRWLNLFGKWAPASLNPLKRVIGILMTYWDMSHAICSGLNPLKRVIGILMHFCPEDYRNAIKSQSPKAGHRYSNVMAQLFKNSSPLSLNPLKRVIGILIARKPRTGNRNHESQSPKAGHRYSNVFMDKLTFNEVMSQSPKAGHRYSNIPQRIDLIFSRVSLNPLKRVIGILI